MSLKKGPNPEKLKRLKTAGDFKRFFEAIPSRKWCTGVTQGEHGRSCALGHLGCETDTEYSVVKTVYARLTRILGCTASTINDGSNPNFQQRGPRARILAALDAAMKEKQK